MLNKIKFKVNNTTATQALVFLPYVSIAKEMRKIRNNPIKITKEVPDHFRIAEYTRFSRIIEHMQNNIKYYVSVTKVICEVMVWELNLDLDLFSSCYLC